MKALILCLFVTTATAQVTFRMNSRITEGDGLTHTVKDTTVIWGMHRGTFEFILPNKHLVLSRIKMPTYEDHDTEQRLILLELDNEKAYIRTDNSGNRYIVRILSSENGYIIFLNSIDYYCFLDFTYKK